MEITTSSIRGLAHRCEEFLDDRGESSAISYPGSLALCILDSVYSTGSHPNAVDNVVDRYIARHGREDGAKSLRYSIAAAGGAEVWAEQVVCNLKPASTHPGAVLKAEVVDQATRLMAEYGIDTVTDLLETLVDEPSPGRSTTGLARRWRDLPSQRSGISWKNLLMLAGSPHFEIDYRVTNCIAEVAGFGIDVTDDYVLVLIEEVADVLGAEEREVRRIVWQLSHRRLLSKRKPESTAWRYGLDADSDVLVEAGGEGWHGGAEAADPAWDHDWTMPYSTPGASGAAPF